MSEYLYVLVAIPLLGFLGSFLVPNKSEKLISWWSVLIVGSHMLIGQFFTLGWFFSDGLSWNYHGPSIITTHNFDFFISFYFDRLTATFLTIGGILTFLITVYSRVYMHRERGFRRFFSTILFFYLGYNVIVLSGNFEVLMTGWEILGISSFLLIAFYRNRFLPVKNALKVFSIYRLGDLGLILVAWISHILMEENVTFAELNNLQLVTDHLSSHSFLGFLIAILLLISASVKSAQFPFSTWLPRAMEGPTPSSAIFYGSLSVHMGCFILIRTIHLWEHQISARFIIGIIGLITSYTCNATAKTQSSIKSQIAYASLSQIGFIFVEIALGWIPLALFHLAGNAFLRTYQLLVSPSVVSYLIREQQYKNPDAKSVDKISKWKTTLYVLAMKEWNIDFYHDALLWHPLKVLGRKVSFVKHPGFLFFFISLTAALALSGKYYSNNALIMHSAATTLAGLGLLFVLQSFAERHRPLWAWTMIALNHIWLSLAVSMNSQWEFHDILIYLSGVIVSWLAGFIILYPLLSKEASTDLSTYYGHVYEYKARSFLFLITCLGLSGFPITPTFIGEDLIFHHISSDQVGIAFFVAFSYVLNGLSIMRIFARVFLGPHIKTYHEIAYKSS